MADFLFISYLFALIGKFISNLAHYVPTLVVVGCIVKIRKLLKKSLSFFGLKTYLCTANRECAVYA